MEQMKLRNKSNSSSASQERRNSVSDIKEFFQPKSQAMSTRKTSGKKDKERAKEAREALENIKSMIAKENEKSDNDQSVSANANGDTQLTCNQDHDTNSSVQNENATLTSDETLTHTTSIATQTSEDEILKAIRELAVKYQKIEDVIEHPKNGLSNQLAKAQEKISNLHSDIHGAVNGILVRLQSVSDTATENTAKIGAMEATQTRMAALLDENKRLVKELKILQGLVQKVSQHTTQNSTQLLDLTRRGMEQNLILHGVDNTIEIEDPKMETPMFKAAERPKHSALEFFKKVLDLNLEPEDIWKAHRTGVYKEGKVKPLIVKVSYSAKELIMENVGRLKGLSNGKTKQKYFVSEQIPEGVVEANKQTANRAKVLREANDEKAPENRQKIQVIKDKILVDGILNTPDITTPQPSQLFLDSAAQKEVDKIQANLMETETKVIRNSEFLAIATKVHSLKEVQQSYVAVLQRYPASDHAMMAYALREDHQVKSGFCDDGEYGAGITLKKLLFEQKVRNTAIFVLRKYGGIHLGFNRFAAIQDIATEALNMLGAITQ